MPLEVLAKQYHIRCQFYAEEIAKELSQLRHTTMRNALRILSESEVPLIPEMMMSKLAPINFETTNRVLTLVRCYAILRALYHYSLARVSVTKDRKPFYVSTDLGRMVIQCLPSESILRPEKSCLQVLSIPLSGSGYIDWIAHRPQMDALYVEGKTHKEVAEILGFRYGTLMAYWRREHLREESNVAV